MRKSVRYLYTFLLYLSIPFILLRLFFRSLKLKAYRYRMKERFGFYPQKIEQSLWIHAVSLGETIAATPLIKALKLHFPEFPLVVTSMTPTGATQVKQVFGDQVYHLYLPYDLPYAIKRFFKTINPVAGIIIETELWPNLLNIAKQKKIPMMLANARLSEKSFKGYAKLGHITKDMIASITYIAAHAKSDAERFLNLGATKTQMHLAGNLKFEMALPQNIKDRCHHLRKQLGENRFIWLAASTHEGEEKIILNVHERLCCLYPNSLLILAPRHPDRFSEVSQLAKKKFVVKHHSRQEQVSNANVYLNDTVGELLLMYGVCDVAFVGGSLIPRGGHNILEAAALAKPILTGSYLHNFAEISELLIHDNALQIVFDEETLTNQLIILHDDEKKRSTMGLCAQAVFKKNSGALQRHLDLIKKLIQTKYKLS